MKQPHEIIEDYFERLRQKGNFHLGMGDVRITPGMVDELVEMVKAQDDALEYIPYVLGAVYQEKPENEDDDDTPYIITGDMDSEGDCRMIDFKGNLGYVNWRYLKDGSTVKLADSLDEYYAKLEKEKTNAMNPICIGKPIIEILAKEGAWTSEDGNSVIAADCLFEKNPYECAMDHLIKLHKFYYGLIPPEKIMQYLIEHLREDADLADLGRPLKYQYQIHKK
jgi:hypothetical protein